ncbi:MAG TPA: hypothetical protein VEC76_01940 [Streptosporangiaceae bacterium]|nr:hypothetical protein [Streptosporangiaceae bacterium]
MGVDHAGGEPEFLTDEAQRFPQVGVVGDQDRRVTVTPAGVQHQVRGERDV